MKTLWILQVTGCNKDILDAAIRLGETYRKQYLESRSFFDEEDGSDGDAVGDFTVKSLAELAGVMKVICDGWPHLTQELYCSFRRASDSQWIGQVGLGTKQTPKYETSLWAASALKIKHNCH
jgi:hypothetical protein